MYFDEKMFWNLFQKSIFISLDLITSNNASLTDKNDLKQFYSSSNAANSYCDF